jgi:hypothetical protein
VVFSAETHIQTSQVSLKGSAMIETATDAKTRDAYRAAHYERSRAFGELLNWLGRKTPSR